MSQDCPIVPPASRGVRTAPGLGGLSRRRLSPVTRRLSASSPQRWSSPESGAGTAAAGWRHVRRQDHQQPVDLVVGSPVKARDGPTAQDLRILGKEGSGHRRPSSIAVRTRPGGDSGSVAIIPDTTTFVSTTKTGRVNRRASPGAAWFHARRWPSPPRWSVRRSNAPGRRFPALCLKGWQPLGAEMDAPQAVRRSPG